MELNGIEVDQLDDNVWRFTPLESSGAVLYAHVAHARLGGTDLMFVLHVGEEPLYMQQAHVPHDDYQAIMSSTAEAILRPYL